MTFTKKRLILIGVFTTVLAAMIFALTAARALRNRIEPYIKEQAVGYLSERFDADVEIAALHISLPPVPQLKLWLTHGRGVPAEVNGEGIVLRRRSRPQEPAILSMRNVSFQVDVGRIFAPRKEIQRVIVAGLEVHVPPKGDRPTISGGNLPGSVGAGVLIEALEATDTVLFVHPADARKNPLEFRIQRLHLRSNGQGRPMTYEAILQNPRPPGQIESKGTFGPWAREEPGSSPLQGSYAFTHADLSVFSAIAGILESTGTFDGELSHVRVHGEARVPDFRLKRGGNASPLTAQFEAEVDGTNGDTILKPVHARLRNSNFVTSGAVIKHDGDPRRTIDLTVKMASGRLDDFLRLAMKGPSPFMEGSLSLDANIGIPPLAGKVVEKLRLRGIFAVKEGKFLKSTIQDRLDELSRRAQGQPKNEGIDQVVSRMTGAFVMENEAIHFERLSFGIPGADIDLAGTYDLAEEELDFRGSLRLEAKASQTQTGVKRIILRPLDPLLSRNGAGTFLKIRIKGTRDRPSFGLDHGK